MRTTPILTPLLGSALVLVLAAAETGSDPVRNLAAKLEKAETKLEYDQRLSYLPSLLKNLNIDPDSQVLVFSKTSFQSAKISPEKPRAIFFNDDVSVGSVQDSDVFELLSTSPEEGVVYHTIKSDPGAVPKFEKQTSACNSCHAPLNFGLPGMMLTTVFPDENGTPFPTGTFFPPVDHRTPIEDRWGGWYVTGTHGSQQHRGNAIVPDPSRPADLETEGTQNRTTLPPKVNLSTYYKTSSDIVALMTLDHQSAMTNYLVRLGLNTRDGVRNGSATAGAKRIEALADETVAYMLFSGEAKLTSPIAGTSRFTQSFTARGPFDSKGRSLREFDLQKRMFKYPLSYMIYSAAFDNMPQAARDTIYKKLYAVLTSDAKDPKFAHLSAADRQAILEVVRDTKPNLPEYWK